MRGSVRVLSACAILLSGGEGVAQSKSCLDPFLIHSDKRTEIEGHSTLSGGGVSSNTFVKVGHRTQLTGNLRSGGNATLEFRAKIIGRVTVHGTLISGHGAEVTDTIVQGATLRSCVIPQKTVDAGARHITVSKHNPRTLNPGKYGVVRVLPFGKLTLKSGVYSFKSLEIDTKAQIIVKLKDAPLEINLTQRLRFGNYSAVSFSGIYNPAWVRFYTNQFQDVVLGTGAKFRGILTAPRANIDAQNNVDVQGALYGHKVKLGRNAKILSVDGDSDGDGAPDVVEAIAGTSPDNPQNKPQWAKSNKVARNPGENEVIEYYYSLISGYSSRERVPIGIEANLLADNLAPVVWVASPSDYNNVSPSLAEGYTVLGAVFNIRAMVDTATAVVDKLTMGIALPDTLSDEFSSATAKVYRFDGLDWVEIPIDEITPDAVYFASSLFGPVALAVPIPGSTIFVDSATSAAPQDQNGNNWDSAYANLAAAIDVAGNNLDVVKFIYVAKGTYYPTTSTPQSETNRNKSFQLPEGVFLQGGFPGGGDWSLDPKRYETILSGDIGEFDGADNCFTVVKGANGAALSGFVIENGSGDGDTAATAGNRNGAGMDILNSSPAIRNCVFRNNHTSKGNGGGVFILNSNATFENCVFFQNTADGDVINGNITGAGGAVYNVNSSPAFHRCRFLSNTGAHDAGAIITTGFSAPVISSSIFVGHNADAQRGALSVTEQGSLTFVNCTITRNSAHRGNEYVHTSPSATSTFLNSIFWNQVEPRRSFRGPTRVSHSIVNDSSDLASDPDLVLEAGNKSSDPQFVDASGCGSIDCPELQLRGGPFPSPAIDAAAATFVPLPPGSTDPEPDLAGQARLRYPLALAASGASPFFADMGSYEYNGDADGDGLPDDWEILGKGELNLPALGANWQRKDVFLELDYMEGNPDSGQACLPEPAIQPEQCFRPKDATIQDVVNAFANAPVQNPDGSTGITLHAEISNSFPYDYDYYGPGDERVKGDTNNFSPIRQNVYHYGIFVVRFDFSAGGWASGSNFTVTWPNEDGFPLGRKRISAIVMHELGHTLGLAHGGPDWANLKPNYLSVMNSLFTALAGTDQLIPHVTGEKLDYSRFSLETLQEATLDEPRGLKVVGPNQSELSGYGTRVFRCIRVCMPDTVDTTIQVCKVVFTGEVTEIPNAEQGADWSNDGDILDFPVKGDINCDGDSTSALTTHNDWIALNYKTGGIGGLLVLPFEALPKTHLFAGGVPCLKEPPVSKQKSRILPVPSTPVSQGLSGGKRHGTFQKK